MSLTEIDLRSTMKDLREGVNGNFAALEGQLLSGLAEKAEIVVGSYNGDGENSQFIVLGFQPKAVLVAKKDGTSWDGNCDYGGFFTPVNHKADAATVWITENGFRAFYYANSSAHSPYVYLALR